jgi:hypothetical protein
MNRAGMPETSIDEHSDASAREDDIGTDDPSWDSERQVLSEPQAPAMQLRTQRNLGARVAAQITAHPCADRRAGWLWIWERHGFYPQGQVARASSNLDDQLASIRWIAAIRSG